MSLLYYGQPACDVHGPMRHRAEPSRWVCLGFDGEECSAEIPAEAVGRVAAGITRWPGITFTWEQIGSA